MQILQKRNEWIGRQGKRWNKDCGKSGAKWEKCKWTSRTSCWIIQQDATMPRREQEGSRRANRLWLRPLACGSHWQYSESCDLLLCGLSQVSAVSQVSNLLTRAARKRDEKVCLDCAIEWNVPLGWMQLSLSSNRVATEHDIQFRRLSTEAAATTSGWQQRSLHSNRRMGERGKGTAFLINTHPHSGLSC